MSTCWWWILGGDCDDSLDVDKNVTGQWNRLKISEAYYVSLGFAFRVTVKSVKIKLLSVMRLSSK